LRAPTRPTHSGTVFSETLSISIHTPFRRGGTRLQVPIVSGVHQMMHPADLLLREHLQLVRRRARIAVCDAMVKPSRVRAAPPG